MLTEKLVPKANKPTRRPKKTATSNEQQRNGTLANDSTNVRYQTTDSVHLNTAATKKLSKNPQIREDPRGVDRNTKHPLNRNMSHRSRNVNNRDVGLPRPVQTSRVDWTTDGELSDTFSTTARQEAARSTQLLWRGCDCGTRCFNCHKGSHIVVKNRRLDKHVTCLTFSRTDHNF